MRKIFQLFPLIFLFLSCSADDELRKNPYLPELNFSFSLDLSLPQYNKLNFPGNTFVTRNYGLNGIVVYNLNNDQYLAYELSDPNHVLTDCSVLVVEGLEAKCSCEDANVYSIITGQLVEGQGQYSLKPYRIQRTGQILRISN